MADIKYNGTVHSAYSRLTEAGERNSVWNKGQKYMYLWNTIPPVVTNP